MYLGVQMSIRSIRIECKMSQLIDEADRVSDDIDGFDSWLSPIIDQAPLNKACEPGSDPWLEFDAWYYGYNTVKE
jgi:hypothetical protein